MGRLSGGVSIKAHDKARIQYVKVNDAMVRLIQVTTGELNENGLLDANGPSSSLAGVVV